MMFLLDVVIKSSFILAVAFAAASMLRSSSAAMRHMVLAVGLGCSAVSPLVTLMMPEWGTSLAPAIVRTAAPELEPAPGETTIVLGPAATVNAAQAESPRPLAQRLLTDRNVLLLWGAGAICGLLLLAAGFSRLTWIAKDARRAARRWQETLADVSARHGLAAAPRLLQSDHPSLLVTWGVFQPAVLLPASASEWSADRARVVLDHELAHIARRDWIVQIGAELVRCLYWFNPFVWIACRRLRQESEQACDDRVLSMGHAGTAYAAHLLDLARALRLPDRLWVPAAAIARPSNLERRIAAMLTTNLNRKPVGRRNAIAVALLLLAFTLPVATYEVVAQARFATVSGVVTDESGAILVDVTLSLTNIQSKAKYEVRSNQTGLYEFAGLPAADYELEVRRVAFEAVREPLTVGVGESLQKNVTLRVGQVQETITVLGGKPRQPSSAPASSSRAPRPCPNAAVGGCIGPPTKLRDVPPVYPPALENSGIEGEVEIEATIGTDGRVTNMRVISSPHPDFERSALDAVGAWEFTPTTLNGRTIETRMKVRVGFGASPRVP